MKLSMIRRILIKVLGAELKAPRLAEVQMISQPVLARVPMINKPEIVELT